MRLVPLYGLARSVINNMTFADQQEDYMLHSSHIAYRTLCLASATVFRVLRSDILPQSELYDSEGLYFEAIRLLKKKSLQNDDLEARQTILKTQLWGSTKVFRQPDGTFDSLRVRLRSRGAMSINYDCYWYCKSSHSGRNAPVLISGN